MKASKAKIGLLEISINIHNLCVTFCVCHVLLLDLEIRKLKLISAGDEAWLKLRRQLRRQQHQLRMQVLMQPPLVLQVKDSYVDE